MKILIVGADREQQTRLAAWIPVATSYQVIEASGMLSALWYAETEHPDLVVVDLWPPDCCGQRLAELMRLVCPQAQLVANGAGGAPPFLPWPVRAEPQPPVPRSLPEKMVAFG